MKRFAVILAAAGRSARFGNRLQKKVYANIGTKPLWMYAAEAFTGHPSVGQIILVIAADDKESFHEKFAGHAAMLGLDMVLGGAERADSVRNGLQAMDDRYPFVAVHDAARPCVDRRSIDAVFETAKKTGAAILATPCHATLKRADSRKVVTETVSRESLWLAQTPQVFRTEWLKDAYTQHPSPSQATDEASLVEALGHSVHLVPGNFLNIKVTTQADLKFAELALKSLPKAQPFPF